MPNIALFDLDYTLIDIDSDHAWGDYLCRLGKVDAAEYKARNDQFYADYRAGVLDMPAFLAFSLEPLGRLPWTELLSLRNAFMESEGRPHLLAKARALVEEHRAAGDRCAIVTATNQFVTQPFAEAFGVETLLATAIETRDGRPTGKPLGQPCFREGKIVYAQAWLDSFGGRLQDCSFYTDSHNDLPLLEQVGRPVAVDPDEKLAQAAQARGWERISLR